MSIAEPYVPYSANITAMTRGGEGAVSTKIFYTAETGRMIFHLLAIMRMIPFISP